MGSVREEEARKFESRGAHPYHDWDDDDVDVVLGVFVTLGNLERRTERGGHGARDITLGFLFYLGYVGSAHGGKCASRGERGARDIALGFYVG